MKKLVAEFIGTLWLVLGGCMAGKLKLNGVVFMDFRQHIRAIFLDCTPAFGQ